MRCDDAKRLLLDHRRGRLGADEARAVKAHLEECAACRAEDAAEGALDAALTRLPGRDPPPALARTLEARWVGRPAPSRHVRTALAMVAGAAIALAVADAVRFAWPSQNALVAEAVSDHLRVIYAERPVEIASGGIHQVKPWFTGRLDFAPLIAFAGDDDFPLEGGSVAVFMDRKAAAFVFKRRLHTVTLFVFRADGLPWPAVGAQPVGSAHATVATSRGFHVVLWRDGELGYALVSDVTTVDLLTLGAKVAGGT